LSDTETTTTPEQPPDQAEQAGRRVIRVVL
jgi:hypothetical protein